MCCINVVVSGPVVGEAIGVAQTQSCLSFVLVFLTLVGSLDLSDSPSCFSDSAFNCPPPVLSFRRVCQRAFIRELV